MSIWYFNHSIHIVKNIYITLNFNRIKKEKSFFYESAAFLYFRCFISSICKIDTVRTLRSPPDASFVRHNKNCYLAVCFHVKAGFISMSAKDKIVIRGARVHNLKNINVTIPQGKLVVITGLSGSGKSSLAFDTLFAEGQRRYVESLSAYARQFLGRMNKPDVDDISGISPSIAIQQKVATRNPRSTVGTSTEIYDYLKLLFARIGKVFSPVSGREVRAYQPSDVVDYVVSLPPKTRALITAPIPRIENVSLIEHITLLVNDGFDRFYTGGRTLYVDELMPEIAEHTYDDLLVVVDRCSVSDSEELLSTLNDSVQTAMQLGEGDCCIVRIDREQGDEIRRFSNRFEEDGIAFEPPQEHLFSFNNPLGACKRCEGYGKIVGIDEDLVIPNKTKSVFEDAIACYRGETMKWWKQQIIDSAERSGFPIHRPYLKLSGKEREMLWQGCEFFPGIHQFFAMLEKERYKIQNRVLISRYTGKCLCPVCKGTRLRKEATYVRVGGYTIVDLVRMPAARLLETMENLSLSAYDADVARQLLVEIKTRLRYLIDVGLDYLTLDRLSNSLSGGESQRINLATSLGSSLVGSMYILDEPSIGLHPRDTQRLIRVLKQLRDLDNTVIVVEHDKEIMMAADYIIDIGPRAGIEGGEVVFAGTPEELKTAKNSLTADYICGRLSIDRPKTPRPFNSYIRVEGACENNLKNISVRIPVGAFTCITGVSGSGKSSLVQDILYPALFRHFNKTGTVSPNFDSLTGDLQLLGGVEMIDQNPIGRSSRSNPVTYIKAYDEIRKIFSEQPEAKLNGLTPAHFSFNIAGGRCEECQGEGVLRVEMQFMSDIVMVCDHCNGRRFKDEILNVKYRGYSIDQVLEMSIDEAMTFFGEDPSPVARRVTDKLRVLQDVGLGYVKLGQSSSTLSGGESQRVKLASYLLKEDRQEPLIFIFDEPTTGLHFHDIKKLLAAFDALIAKGHTLVVVEHNMDVVKCADYIIDLGPEGGEAGGNLVFEGSVDKFLTTNEGYTVGFLKEAL